MLRVELTRVGDAKVTLLVSGSFSTTSDALIAARARCKQIFDEERFSFKEITRYVFMIERDGANAGLILITDEG